MPLAQEVGTRKCTGSPQAAHPPRPLSQKSQVTPGSALPDSAHKPQNDALQHRHDLRAGEPVPFVSLKGSAGRRTGSREELLRRQPPPGLPDGARRVAALAAPRLSAPGVTSLLQGSVSRQGPARLPASGLTLRRSRPTRLPTQTLPHPIECAVRLHSGTKDSACHVSMGTLTPGASADVPSGTTTSANNSLCLPSHHLGPIPGLNVSSRVKRG